MKRFAFALLALLLSQPSLPPSVADAASAGESAGSPAAPPSQAAPEPARAAPVEDPASCAECSMDRTRFAHSRMLVEFADGETVGVCSVHCAAAALLEARGRKVAALKVADYGTKELIDARKAFWVVGGKVRGVMTGVPKWAFARKADAQAFVRENGGAFATFDRVLRDSRREAIRFRR